MLNLLKADVFISINYFVITIGKIFGKKHFSAKLQNKFLIIKKIHFHKHLFKWWYRNIRVIALQWIEKKLLYGIIPVKKLMESYRKSDNYSMIWVTYQFDWSQLAEHNLDRIAKKEPCNNFVNGFPRRSMTQAQNNSS